MRTPPSASGLLPTSSTAGRANPCLRFATAGTSRSVIDENARVVCATVRRQTEPMRNSLARGRNRNIRIPPKNSLTATIQFNRPIEIESTRGSRTGAGLSHGLAKPAVLARWWRSRWRSTTRAPSVPGIASDSSTITYPDEGFGAADAIGSILKGISNVTDCGILQICSLHS